MNARASLSLRSIVPLLVIPLLLFASCARKPLGMAPAATAALAGDTTPQQRFAKPPAEERPGLATGWGERRESAITMVNFQRAHGNTPAGTGMIYYDDRARTQAMLAQAGGDPKPISGPQRLVRGFVSVGLQSDTGAWLDGWELWGTPHIVGEKGQRYAVVVRNETPRRLEFVTSVDGLDVLDGKPASRRKRGYLLDAGQTYAIEGFRTGSDAVAAFRFSAVSQSYAALQHDDTRNVGVIGIAVFTERNREVEQRRRADPFPRSWATPPRY